MYDRTRSRAHDTEMMLRKHVKHEHCEYSCRQLGSTIAPVCTARTPRTCNRSIMRSVFSTNACDATKMDAAFKEDTHPRDGNYATPTCCRLRKAFMSIRDKLACKMKGATIEKKNRARPNARI